MKLKKIVSALLVCGMFVTALADPLAAIKPVEVQAAGADSFRNVSLARSYKDTSEHNPVITQKFSADPCAMEYNGRVYVYSTNDGIVGSVNGSAENTYAQINQINVMSSEDMVNWTDHGSINVAGSNGVAKWAGNSWAPTAAHKTINGKEKFFLYFANNANGIGVLTSDSPTGPWTDPNGRALISRSTPNCSDVTWLFDPAVLVDSDGTGYLYFGGGVPNGKASNPGTARVVKLASNMTSLAGNPVRIDAPWIFEDSAINKVGNTYIYSYCTNWNGGPYGNARIAYMTSSNPMGPFTFKGVCFNNPGDFFQTAGNNHHSMVQHKGQYYIFYHAEYLNKKMFGSQKGYRTTHVDTISASSSGFGTAKGTLSGVKQLSNVNAFAVNRAASMAWQGGISVNGLGNTTVAYNRGDWTGVSNVDFGSGAKSVTLKAQSNNGATIRISAGSASGSVIGYVEIPAGSGYRTVTANISGVTGVKNVFFTASGDCSVETWQFSGNGGSTQQPTEEPTQAPVQNPDSGVASGNSSMECEDMTLSGTYAGRITSPFSGAVFYANNDTATYTQQFGYDTHDFTLRGCSNNNNTAAVDLKLNGTKVGTFYFRGTTPTDVTLKNIKHATGDVKIELTVTTDDNTWDVYVDSLKFAVSSADATQAPTVAPTQAPTVAPTQAPTVAPTQAPTQEPQQPVVSGNIADGWYYIKAVGSQKYLQVANSSAQAGANVVISTGNGNAGQVWKVTNTNDGYITLTSKLGDFMLDVANGSGEDGANIGIYNAYSGDAQKFVAKEVGNGIYTINTKSSNSQKVLDVEGRKTADGTNVCQYRNNGQTNQQWQFELVAGQSEQPTVAPTQAPTQAPTVAPTQAPTVEPTKEPATQVPQTSGKLEATYTVNSWGSGYQVSFKITNKSNAAVNNWTLKIKKSECKIDTCWNVTLVESGDYYVITPVSWNSNIPVGGSVEFGALGTGSVSTINCSVN